MCNEDMKITLNNFYDFDFKHLALLREGACNSYSVQFLVSCVDEAFLDQQLDWLMRWKQQCEQNITAII